MAKLSNQNLKREIEAQSTALKRISRWITWLILLDSVAVLLLYTGLSLSPVNWVMTAAGTVLLILGVMATVTVGYGYHNGKKNVEKMIHVLEKNLRNPADQESSRKTDVCKDESRH